MDTLTWILDKKIVAIIRGAEPENVPSIVESLYRGGINIVEVTMNSKSTLDVIEKISSEFENRVLIGAGTVLDTQSVNEAVDAGAKFIISPCLDKKIIRETIRLGAVSIPGAFTASEIVKAHNTGADIVKVFPASIGTSYFTDLRGPLPHIRLMPTGGVSLDNISVFHKAGAAAFGIGSALVRRTPEFTDEYLRTIEENARKFVQAIA